MHSSSLQYLMYYRLYNSRAYLHILARTYTILAHARASSHIPAHTRAIPHIPAHTRAYSGIPVHTPGTTICSRAFPPQW